MEAARIGPEMTPRDSRYQIAADVGGTFTDLVMVDEKGGLWLEKLPSTPPDFERAVLKMMAKRQEDRYGSAAELAADLERIGEASGG